MSVISLDEWRKKQASSSNSKYLSPRSTQSETTGLKLTKEELELVHEEALEINNWYKLSVQDVHSVENLQSTRLCLARQLPNIPLDLL